VVQSSENDLEAIKQMSDLEKLRTVFRSWIGLLVQHCGLLIWPDEAGRAESDTRLYLLLAKGQNQTLAVSLGVGEDGQSPIVEYGTWQSEHSLNDLPRRIIEWKNPAFWSQHSSHRYESFSVENCDEFRGVIGFKIKSISVLVFEDERMDPTGIVLDLESGTRIWVVPGVCGTSVHSKLPNNWLTFRYKEVQVV
jgi:hypothetical protein